MKRSFYSAFISFVFLIIAALNVSSTFASVNVVACGAVVSNTLDLALPNPQSIQAGTITTLPITGVYCANSSVVVNFTTSGATFAPGNVFTAQLSDGAGSFASPVAIGTLNQAGVVNAASIFAVIPNGTPFFTGYRIRVISSDESIIGSDNGSDITIKVQVAPPIPTVIANGPTDFCFGSATTFLTSSAPTGNSWYNNGVGGTNTNPFIGVVGSGCYYTQVTGNNGCSTSSVPVCINVNTPIFTYLGYFNGDSLVTTADTTVTICEGDSAQIGIIIEGGVAPFDIFYTYDGLNTVTVNDVGVPYGANSNVYTFNSASPGIYQLIGITDNFPTNCGANSSLGIFTLQTAPRPITDFSYNPFCGTQSQIPVLAPQFLTGGVFSIDSASNIEATVNPTTGIISNTQIGGTYIIKYTVQGPNCETSSTATVVVDSVDVVSFTIDPFCANTSSLAPNVASGFSFGGSFSISPFPVDLTIINSVTGIISNASPNTTYNVVYTSAPGACQSLDSTTVSTLASPTVSGTVINSLCGQSIGSINASVVGNATPFTFVWSNTSTTEDISDLLAGSYTLIATDTNGCSDDSTFTITNTNQPQFTFDITNATCGNQNGEINLSVTDTTGPVTYLWDFNNLSTQDISGLEAGTYSVQITDGGTTCVVNGSASVANQNAPIVTLELTPSLCGQSVGGINVTVSGGTGSITHSWSNGTTLEDLLNIPKGTYTDTVRDDNCQVIIIGEIINSNQFTSSSEVINPTCENPSSGEINVSIQGGTAPFTFTWSPNTSDFAQSVSNLTPGEYQVIIADDSSCVDTLVTTIAPLPNISLTYTKVDATCGNNDGSINLSVEGGSGAYVYVWSSGATTQDLTNLALGNYSVIVKDASDTTCTSSIQVPIINENLPTSSYAISPSSCTINDGSINLTLLPAGSNFTFSWSGPDGFTATTEDINSLAAGEYSVVILDTVSTCSLSDTVSVNLSQAPQLEAVVVNTTCNQNNGLIDITITGGTAPIQVLWSNFSTNQDQLNLSPGTYDILVIDSANCSITQSYEILPSLQPTISSIIVNPTCGNDTGSVDITVADTTNPVTYNWKFNGSEFSNSDDLQNLAAGTYILEAIDGAGCFIRDTAILVYPNQPTLSTDVTDTQCSTSTGAIDLTVSGGLAPFSYYWIFEGDTISNNQNITDLAFGCYNANVIDANGCEASTQACVLELNAPQITFQSVQPSCNLNNGSLTATLQGGIAPFSFVWQGSTSDSSSAVGLSAGEYQLTVTDANGCEAINSSTLVNSGVPTLTANQIDPTCGNSDGSIDLIVSGGISPYSFNWSNLASTEDINSLPAGNYSVVVTDSAGCEVTGQFVLENSDGPQISFTQTNTTCGNFNGAIDITVIGGSGNYTYAWSGQDVNVSAEDQSDLSAGDYSVVVTDNVGGCVDSTTITITNTDIFTVTPIITNASCGLNNGGVSLQIQGGTSPFTYNWCNGSSLAIVSNLPAGDCEVTITDNAGCEVTETFTILSTGSPTISEAVTPTTCGICNGGIALTVEDGNDPYTYLWNNGASTSSLNNLCSGSYSVTITDSVGCEAQGTFIVPSSTPITLTSDSTQSTCGTSSGSINLSVSGGSGPYTYSWNGPGVNNVSTQDLSNLTAGAYTVIVGDTNNCSQTLTTQVTNSDQPILSFAVSNATCGNPVGGINLTVTGSTGPFTYIWTGPNSFTASTQDINNVPSGDYTITVSAGICTTTDSVSIINSDAPTASISISNDTICSGESATLTINLTGTAPFNLVYFNGNNIVNVNNFNGNLYTTQINPSLSTTYSLISLISVNDPSCSGNFLIDSASIQVNPNPVQPVITASGSLNLCNGQSVTLTSNYPVNNSWNITGVNQFNQSITVSAAGEFTVTYTNQFNCSATSDTVTVNLISVPTVSAGNDVTICKGVTTQLQASGAVDYVWSPSIGLTGTIISNPAATPLVTTIYTVTGTNACGSDIDTLIITVLPVAEANLGEDLTVCQNDTLQFAVENLPTATYSWGPSSAFIGSTNTFETTVLVNTTADIYVTTTNSNGCIDTDTLTINVIIPQNNPIITAQGPTTFCSGESVVLTSSTGNFVEWSNGLENVNQILVTTSGQYFVALVSGQCPAYSDTIEVVVNNIPNATIQNADGNTVCQGSCATLGALISTGVSWSGVGSGNTQSIQACISGDYILTVSQNGCSASDTTTIFVSPIPAIPTISPSGSVSICEGQSVTLVSSSNIGNQWNLSGIPIIGANLNGFNTNSSGTFSVTFTSPDGCSSTSENVVVTVKPVTPIDIVSNKDTVVCTNQPIEVTLSVQPTTGFASFLWSTGADSTSILAIDPGIYTVTATNADGCSVSSSITLIGIEGPSLTIESPVYFDNYNISKKNGKDGSINLTVEGGSPSYTFTWSNNSTSEDLFNLPAGNYYVTVTDANGCFENGAIVLLEPGDIVLPNGFTPNGDGFNDFYVIKGIQGYKENKISIFNRWGSIVYSKSGYTNDWSGISNDGNVLPNGTYYIVVEFNDSSKENIKGYIDLRK
jgi:gliding motility-associated-like protein